MTNDIEDATTIDQLFSKINRARLEFLAANPYDDDLEIVMSPTMHIYLQAYADHALILAHAGRDMKFEYYTLFGMKIVDEPSYPNSYFRIRRRRDY